MADIDVVRDSNDNRGPGSARARAGTPGRVAGHRRSALRWILPLLLVAVVALWFFNRDRLRAVPDAVGTSGVAATDTVRDVGGVTTAAANQRAELEEVSVASVTGDRTFWITDASGDRALVMIQERGGEQQTVIRQGQRLNVQGTIVRAGGISAGDTGDRQALKQSPMVIQADRVTPAIAD